MSARIILVMPHTKNTLKSSDAPAYRLDTAAVMHGLNTTPKGISPTQATARLAQYGPNQLSDLHHESVLFKFLRQFRDLMIILLIVSAGISLYLGDHRTSLILAVLVFLNACIGFFQEHKAERIMQSLERLTIPEAKVIRGGTLVSIRSMEIVPGDVVYVEEGDSVPADLRLIEESELATNDFALTGESNPSRKFTHAMSQNVEIGDRHNLLFMGTTVAIGHGYGVAIGTGMHTELGHIANLSEGTKKSLSPLQKEMNHIAARITQGTIILSVFLIIVTLKADFSLREAFLFAIGIASAMIPQGLPAEINASLAQAAGKLAKARALVKKLSAVETLGATSVICTDKTGTLTKNEMTVEHILIGKDIFEASGVGYETNGVIQNAKHQALNEKQLKRIQLFFETGVFASNASVNPPDNEHANWYCVGDPTEGALITLARKAGLNTETTHSNSPELKEFAFDSARKRMSSIRDYNKNLHVFTKGAPESVLEVCTHIWRGGKVKKLTKQDRSKILNQHNTWANEAMRNLAYAYKPLPNDAHVHSLRMEEAESALIFIGMVSMIDPLREDVAKAMDAAHAANIKVSIITGDYAPTARAIAVKARLAEKTEDLVLIQGVELRDMPDEKIISLVDHGGVIFSRVSPEDKLRIVELVKHSGDVVAVTGDGINDAPALKRADIGVAMGRTGTDVAKQSADIVLLDDSFNTLVNAVQQGRIIYQNIQKATLTCLTSNSGELVAVLISLAARAMFDIPIAITAVQILAIDVIAELFPIAALGWDPAERELMHERPRDTKNHILNVHSILDLLLTGILMGGLAYLNFLFFFKRHGINPQYFNTTSALYAKATILTYCTIVVCQFMNILSRRVRGSVFGKFTLTNKHLWIAFAISSFCVLNIVYTPVISTYFNAAPLQLVDWLCIFAAGALFLTCREVAKRFTKPLKAVA